MIDTEKLLMSFASKGIDVQIHNKQDKIRVVMIYEDLTISSLGNSVEDAITNLIKQRLLSTKKPSLRIV